MDAPLDVLAIAKLFCLCRIQNIDHKELGLKAV